MRLRGGDYATAEVFSHEPQAQAEKFIAAGAKVLHVIDLDGAKRGTPQNTAALTQICAVTRAHNVEVQVGGGLRTLADMKRTLELGANFVILGTAATTDPEFLATVMKKFPKKVIWALDICAGELAINGWQERANLSQNELLSWADQNPPAAIIHTDIDCDGKLGGMNIAALRAAAAAAPCPVIASGGFRAPADAQKLAAIKNLSGIIIGRAAYTNFALLKELLRDYAEPKF